MEKKRFAVLLCAEDSDYVKKMHGGYFGVFVSLLGEEGEEWDVFRAARGELPGDGDIGRYDGFVITGSCNDAHGDDGWIRDLVGLLRRLDAMKKKVLGVCFGHQEYEGPSQYLCLISTTKIVQEYGGPIVSGVSWAHLQPFSHRVSNSLPLSRVRA